MARAESSVLWENLYNLYLVIALLVGGLVLGWLFYSMWRFRARPGAARPADAPIAGAIPPERGHPLWSYVMAALIAVIMFGLAFGTISAVETIETPPAEDNALVHDVIGYQFGWKYNVTGAGGIPFQVVTPSEDQMHVPVGRVVVFHVTSQDVWHNFAIPDYRLRVDAIPGDVNTLWFRALQEGEVRHVCVQLCGLNHARMHTMMKVVSEDEYATWLEERSDRAYTRLASDVAKDAKRGAYVNGTLAADGIALEKTTYVPSRPLVLNLTNEDATARSVTLGENTITIEPGQTGRIYLAAPASGEVRVQSGDDAETLKAVTP